MTLSKSKNSNLAKNKLIGGQNKIILNKTRFVNSVSERVALVNNATKISEPIQSETLESPMRRQTYLVEEKENIPNLENNMIGYDPTFTSFEHYFKRSVKNCQNTTFSNHINTQNTNCDIMTDDSLDESLNKLTNNSSPFNNFFLTPLKSTKNLISPFGTTKKISFDIADENMAFTSFTASPFKPIDASTAAKIYTPDNRKPTRVSVNLCEKFEEIPENKLNIDNATFIKNISPKKIALPLNVKQSFNISQNHELTTTYTSIQDTSNLT